MPDTIPFADPRSDNARLREAILASMARVLDRGPYILGPEVVNFEAALAKRLNVAGALGVASGTDALVLALLAAGVQPGDEVITVSHTAGPTVAAIRVVGAVPVLIDVDRQTYCLAPDGIAAALSSRTKALIVVHLYGHPADMFAIRSAVADRGVILIEDCAQAQEATLASRQVGGFGDLSCFSFYPTKNLGALGDGGAVCSNDPEILLRLKELRTYGWSQPQFSTREFGRCSRLDELQAAVLSVKLPHLAEDIDRRRAVAHRYREGLGGLPIILPSERPDCRHAYHLFVIRTDQRDDLESYLAGRGIGTGRHYPFAVHRQPGLAAHARIPAPLAVTEEIAGEILSLPLFASMTDMQVDRVIEAIRSFFKAG